MVSVVALTLFVLLASLAWKTGITVDEPSHLVSAHLYWEGRDNLKPGDMPPLIRIVGGWVPRLLGLPLPSPEDASWKNGHEWDVSLQMMIGKTNPGIYRYFFWSRIALMVFPLSTLVLLWWWARELMGPWPAMLAAVMFALSPSVLGHGALFKNDLAATFGFLLFWYRAWRFWREPNPRSTLWLAAGLLAAVLAKFSMLVLIPIGLLLAATRYWRGLPVLILTLWIGVNAAWQFQTDALKPAEFEAWSANPNVPKPLITFVRVASAIPTPPRMWRGAMSLVESNGDAAPIYFLGQLHPGGHPLYFATALALKIPASLQILMAGGLALCAVSLARGRLRADDSFWLLPAFLYLGLASMSNLQLGSRLVLPAIPFLLLIAARALDVASPKRRAFCALLVVWLAIRMVTAYPYYLSFFNYWAGGPDRGLDYLSDSNIDWGQDLPSLRRYVLDNDIPKIDLAYFGTDNPHNYLPNSRLSTIVPPWSDDLVKSDRYDPRPGYYAISATLLTGQFFAERYRGYFGEFRNRQPIAKAGYSIFIYRIP